MRLRERAQFGELGEHQRHDRPHLLVGIQRDAAIGHTHVSDRHAREQFAPAGLVQLPLVQSRPQDVQLGLAHRPLEAE
jgi:hypothetical protein